MAVDERHPQLPELGGKGLYPLPQSVDRVAVLKLMVVLSALLVLTVACSGPPPDVSASLQPTRPASAIATAAATVSVPARFAGVCGTMSDGVQISRGRATFTLNAPGRAPLKITSTDPAPIDAMVPTGIAQSGYVCLLLDAGVPLPTFAGLIGPGMPGYVVQGTVPATSTNPSPTGFALPQACAFVAPPTVGTDTTVWLVDCGTQANHDARGMLGPAFAQQGWTSCAIGLGSMWVKRNGVMLGVTESTLAPGDYPRLTQPARLISPCT